MTLFKKVALSAAFALTPLVFAATAQADSPYHRHHGHHRRPSCGYDSYRPSYYNDYRSRRPAYAAPYYRAPVSRYGTGYRGGAYGYPYGYRGTAFGVGPQGFSLYIGR